MSNINNGEVSFDPSLLAQHNLVPYSIAAMGTLLVYDWMCTFELEFEYVWHAPISLGTILFALNRYLPFVDTFMSLHLLTANNTPETCLRNFKILTWFIVIGSILAEVVLMLRTYAIWGRKHWVLYALIMLVLAVAIPGVIITNMELASLIYGPSPNNGCSLKHASTVIYIAYVLFILCETVIVTLTVVKAWQHLRRSRSSWVVQLYQDGVLFYIYMLAISIVNIIIPVAAPPALANWFATPQRVMHSILCTRVLLLILRQQKSKGPDAKPPPEFSSIFSTLTSERDTTPNNEINMQDFSQSRNFHTGLHANTEQECRSKKNGIQKTHEYEYPIVNLAR